MTAETLTGTCSCGAEASREKAAGLGADLLNRLPLLCPDCEARVEAETEQAKREEQRLTRESRAHRRIEASGLPLNLRRVDLDQLDRLGCEQALDTARTWITDGGGLLFTGPFGTGKTTIAAGAARAAIVNGRRLRWASAPLLLARLGSGFGTTQREWALEALTGAADLVLDDLDKTRPTDYGAEQVFLAVDSAVTEGRPLITTTNLSLSELAARWPAPFGEAIASRLVGYCRIVELTGADRRLDVAA
jgi:DNA replication protein DnaC